MNAKEQGLPEAVAYLRNNAIVERGRLIFHDEAKARQALAALASDTGERGEVVAWRWPGGHWQDGGPSNRERDELFRAGKDPEYAYSAALRAQPDGVSK